MGKKNMIEEAILNAREIEEASVENAKNIVVEAFAPAISSFFNDVLNEDYELDDEDLFEGTEHDMGKEEDAGREDTDASGEDMDEGIEIIDDINEEWEAEHDGNQMKDPHANEPSGLDGTSPANKTSGAIQDVPDEEDPGEDEKIRGEKISNKTISFKKRGEDPGKNEESGLDGTSPANQKNKDLKEADDKELDIPDELFDDDDNDDEDESEEKVKFTSDIESKDEDMDEGIEIIDDLTESDDEWYEDYDVSDEDLYDDGDDEWYEDDSIEEAHNIIAALQEENEQLRDAFDTLRTQLEESNLFNCKLAYTNKLYESGLFSNTEKENIAERVDDCDTMDEVKYLYKKIVNEVKNRNPLEDFSNVIKESRVKFNVPKANNIFESSEMLREKSRMQSLAGIENLND